VGTVTLPDPDPEMLAVGNGVAGYGMLPEYPTGYVSTNRYGDPVYTLTDCDANCKTVP